ncbi:FabD/lysophospholipase-like protein [Glonium stellatum]|uniref:FabD/lysophospholipase-like protein n=1 Tax=Glonium stellatum TaxID=574774 RepID=A0A8E2EZH3_9PEZI|nr:FabD/lysophospholipase-like protein [Glonium stellatum]
MNKTLQLPLGDSPQAEPILCEVCQDTQRDSSFCIRCDANFCDECRSQQFVHKRGGPGHEKADYRVVKKLREILEPTTNLEKLQSIHRADDETTWFGITRDANNPVFQDYGRYTAVMAGSFPKAAGERFPHLVSFIGQTGAGKSTIIRILIDLIANKSDASPFPAPIAGSRNDVIPTSGDVHLYADPETYYGKYPILYADCEGLEGGEATPRSAQYKEASMANGDTTKADSGTNAGIRNRFRKFNHKRRKIAWADSPDKRKREYAVTQLYPRLLYTFSDVVVFVLQNARTFESAVLHKLLDWALKSIEKSLNQFALPHAIIVLNSIDDPTDDTTADGQWDTAETTRKFFADLDDIIHKGDRFEEHRRFWEDRGKQVNSLQDLLECFYSSVAVVRIPAAPAYMRIRDQTKTLYQEIAACCKKAYETRLSVRMLSDADDLHIFLQCAFDHFSNKLDTPFNFVEVSLRNNPILLDFGGNILKLAIELKNKIGCKDGKSIFQKLSPMVVSCILLDTTRHRSKGKQGGYIRYMDHCNYALDEFSKGYWPCSYSHSSHGSCANARAGHSKGHQNKDGKIIGFGGYTSDFTFNSFKEEWHDILKQKIGVQSKQRTARLQENPNINEEKAVEQLHLGAMREFYGGLGGAAEFKSHATCLCCLRELPEHPLPCGHVLCTSCIGSYRSNHEKSSITMDKCPLHPQTTDWGEPWPISIMPPLAGVRILCLDGGGIRGIVELEVLAEIEKALGGNIPIQTFFDLIVGTSTGGIIALGLGVKKWSVKTITDHFTNLCDIAFTPREFHRLPGIRHLATAKHGSKYKTRPFEKILREHYKEELLFGGVHKGGYSTKVAVVSTTDTGNQATVLSNYNRQQPEDHRMGYKFERPLEPKYELKIWEAARATSAAPPYFKQFVSATGRGYLDGALYHNNPVRIAVHESKLLWPATDAYPPDILLSIGTGSNITAKSGLNGFMPKGLGRQRTFSDDSTSQEDVTKRRRGPRLIETLLRRVDSILDCDRAWTNFLAEVVGSTRSEDLDRRYQRLDLDLRSDPPKLDEKDKLKPLRAIVQERLKETSETNKIKLVARQLVASCFYFDKNGIPAIQNDENYHFLGMYYTELV